MISLWMKACQQSSVLGIILVTLAVIDILAWVIEQLLKRSNSLDDVGINQRAFIFALQCPAADGIRSCMHVAHAVQRRFCSRTCIFATGCSRRRRQRPDRIIMGRLDNVLFSRRQLAGRHGEQVALTESNECGRADLRKEQKQALHF